MIETEAERAPAAEQVEMLLAGLPGYPPMEAFAALEHRFGALPLVEAFFDGVGPQRGSLGLFTPTPDFTWEAAAVAGEWSGAGLVLRGEISTASSTSDGTIVLVRLEAQEHRLAWVEQAAASRWLRLDGVAVGADRVSKPVTLGPGSDFVRCLDAYAGVWALAAAICAGDEIRALRRAARTTQREGKSFSSSQWVSLGITEVEIEAELTLAAARAAAGSIGGTSGLAVAAAAARILHAIAAKAVELRDQAGLEVEGQPQETARALTAFLGGPLLIESELGRAMGIERFA